MNINKEKIKKWVKEDLGVQQGDVERAIELTIEKVLRELKVKQDATPMARNE